MNRPNILYIHSHDTGRWIQPYGHNVPTPNLQRLAEEGVFFRQAHCASPSCSPARAALLTGQYPHTNGMYGLAQHGTYYVDIGAFRLHDMRRHILYTLREAGYFSALFGVEHIVDNTVGGQHLQIGYDRVLSWKPESDDPVATFLDNKPPQPFFLTVGFHETHLPFPAPGPGDEPDFCMPPGSLPDNPITRENFAGFRTSARRLDQKMGSVFDALRRNGLYENTIIIATTDHGIPFPRHKGSLSDGGTGVFLIMRGPGGFEGGRAIDGMIQHMDIFPTLCETIGAAPPKHLQGKSFMPLVRGETDEIHDEIFTELTYHRAYEPIRCIRTKRWKYLRRFDFTARASANSDPNSSSKDFLVAHGWNEAAPWPEALFDLAIDPNEMNNRVMDPRLGVFKEDLRQRLFAWMRDTDDPLLKGAIPGQDGTFNHDRMYSFVRR